MSNIDPIDLENITNVMLFVNTRGSRQALQIGHKYLYAHVSPQNMQNFINKPARNLVLDLVLISTKDY